MRCKLAFFTQIIFFVFAISIAHASEEKSQQPFRYDGTGYVWTGPTQQQLNSGVTLQLEDLGRYTPSLEAWGTGIFRWEKKLQLNKGQPGLLRVGFWGGGSAFAKKQWQSNFVITKGNTVLWVDLGGKMSMRIAEFLVDVSEISHFLPTHSHADHIGSLEEVGLTARYVRPFVQTLKEKISDPVRRAERINELRMSNELAPKVMVPREYAPVLWDHSLRGGLAYSEEDSRGQMSLTDFFQIQHPVKAQHGKYGRDAWEFSIGTGVDKIDIVLFRTMHIPDSAQTIEGSFFSVGMVVDGRVLISGDTKYDPKIFDDMRAAYSKDGLQLILHDTQSFTGGVHASIQELAGLKDSYKNIMVAYHCDDALRSPNDPHNLLGGKEKVQAAGLQDVVHTLPWWYEIRAK